MRSLDQLAATFKLLGSGANVSYVLDAELRIVDMNPAWERFARANGGEQVLESWPRGSSLLAAIPSELVELYRAGFARATRTGQRWEHDYECSSPTLFRKYRMLAYPFGAAFVVTHALLVEQPHGQQPHGQIGAAQAPVYERDGVIAICAHCRRVRHTSVPERWDWVPAYVEPLADNLSHGLCPACYRYYYG